MAVTDTIKCNKCGQQKWVTYSLQYPCPMICDECIKSEKSDAKQQRLDSLALLSVEDRLAKIEEWIYDEQNKPKYNGILG